jgi:hypothetical protein
LWACRATYTICPGQFGTVKRQELGANWGARGFEHIGRDRAAGNAQGAGCGAITFEAGVTRHAAQATATTSTDIIGFAGNTAITGNGADAAVGRAFTGHPILFLVYFIGQCLKVLIDRRR